MAALPPVTPLIAPLPPMGVLPTIQPTQVSAPRADVQEDRADEEATARALMLAALDGDPLMADLCRLFAAILTGQGPCYSTMLDLTPGLERAP